MRKIKNIALIFGHFEEEHIGKDVFLVPFYLGKLYNGKVTIVYPKTATNRSMSPNLRGVDLCPLNQKDGTFFGVLYLLRNFWKIDILMQFHISHRTLILGLLYKCLKPSGILYIKADGLGDIENEKQIEHDKSFKSRITYYLYKMLFKKVDRITIETEDTYHVLREKHFGVKMHNKVFMMVNGFDEGVLKDLKMEEKNLFQKENIFVTVGRIGTYPKNSEMLLQALPNVDLKEWKVVFIGPIENRETDFSMYIDSFFQSYPHLKDSVLFTGPIYDKAVLWEWYNRAKVFVLTSRFESFGIVLMEAFRFRDYILSTKVGFAEEAISYGYGEFLEQEDAEGLSMKLQAIVDGYTLLEESAMPSSRQFEKYSWEYQVSNNLKFDGSW